MKRIIYSNKTLTNIQIRNIKLLPKVQQMKSQKRDEEAARATEKAALAREISARYWR